MRVYTETNCLLIQTSQRIQLANRDWNLDGQLHNRGWLKDCKLPDETKQGSMGKGIGNADSWKTQAQTEVRCHLCLGTKNWQRQNCQLPL